MHAISSENMKQIIDQQYVDQFFKRCNIGGQIKPEQFWRSLEKRFGKLARDLGDCIGARERGEAVNPYPIKNKSLDFANAVAAQFDTPKLKAVALWLIREKLSFTGRIIEIGCDNGILLCLLASLHQDAHFVGIDPCAEAIAVARQRAEHLKLKNIEFRVGALDPELVNAVGSGFELVISVAVFHEILANGFIGADAALMKNDGVSFSIEDTDRLFSSAQLRASVVCNIRELLRDDGHWISVDRWRTDAETLRWIRLAEGAKLSVSLSRSFLLHYKDLAAGSQTLPLTVFTKCELPPAEPCDVLAFKAYAEFLELPGVSIIEKDMLAELFYGALDKQEIFFQESVFNDGSGIERTYLGVARGVGYLYITTSRGYRRLALLPSALIHEKIAEMPKLLAARRQRAEVAHRWAQHSLLQRFGVNHVPGDA